MKPAARRSEVPDLLAPGLYLVVQPSGKKTWAVRCRVRGRPAKVTIGPASAFAVAEARELCRQVQRKAARGEDPRKGSGRTVREVVAEWLLRDQSKNRDGGSEVSKRFDRDVLPYLGDRPIAEVTRRDCRELVDRVADRGSIVSARRLHAHVHRMLAWAAGADVVPANPMAGMPRPGKETARDRVLTDAELGLVWRACGDLGYPHGPAIRLLILTGARRGEIAGLRWDEVDGDSIRLPAERTKAGRPHVVPLSEPALAILASAPRSGAHVFTNTGEGPAWCGAKVKRELDRLMAERARREAGVGEPAEVAHFHVHDLRRTVATGLQRLGHRLEVIEAVLGHVGGSRSGIVGVYQRHAFEPEKGEALRQWSEHITAL